MTKILIVEDDAELAGMVKVSLSFEHYVVEHTEDGLDGLSLLQCYEYDLALVDWELPGINGPDLCRRFRSEGGKTPILMLTGKKAVAEKSHGLDSGADDYLTKPFHAQELLSRVRALLRRSSGNLAVDNSLRVGNLILEPTLFKLTKDGASDEIKLNRKEFGLLELFMRYPGRLFSTDELISRVWTADDETSADTVRTHMKNLRKKIEEPGKPALIETIHGVGYKLVAPRV